MKTKETTKMLNNPRVTFVVTSFNYENYIEKTLESIKNQTYDNFEIIVLTTAQATIQLR